MDLFIKFLWSAVGGGFAAIAFKLIETYWINFRLSENIEARKKLKHYSKVLWFDFHELAMRLLHIKEKMLRKDQHSVDPLKYSESTLSIEWLTKDGYYAASTAYLIASSAAWIRIVQREIVFLEFNKRSITTAFFEKIEDLKQKITGEGSLIWYHYFNGIGEKLINEDTKIPITFAGFVEKLAKDEDFAAFYDQLFRFLDGFSNYEDQSKLHLLDEVLQELDGLQIFLEKHSAIPSLKHD